MGPASTDQLAARWPVAPEACARGCAATIVVKNRRRQIMTRKGGLAAAALEQYAPVRLQEADDEQGGVDNEKEAVEHDVTRHITRAPAAGTDMQPMRPQTLRMNSSL